MSLRLKSIAQGWLAKGEPAMVAEIHQARGSTPRETGARMLISADIVEGTIGGGHLELKAIQAARELLASTTPRSAELHFALGPSLGQCCGGAVDLFLQPLTPEALVAWPDPLPRFTLQLYGAGHVGRAIVRLLEGIACRVQWIDERDDEFPREPSAPHIERLCGEPVEAEVDSAPPGAFYLVLTHSHDLDLRIVEAVLKRGDFGFLGLIGSETKRVRFERRLHERKFSTDTLQRMVCPIGVPGIEGKEPELIAIAAVAQLLQLPSA
ncbi:MAG TPA: xanthine dehydrogenase accessory protein XdhC [Burkholderiaceae bacterium]|nr:xanthine dehydrogenase accessory protein XdhC [Burkholderiaceae bacterium]